MRACDWGKRRVHAERVWTVQRQEGSMKRAFRARWAAVALAVFGLGLAAQPVLAIEFWDERV